MKHEDAFALGSGFAWKIAMEHYGEELEIFMKKLSSRINESLKKHPLDASVHEVVRQNNVEAAFNEGINHAIVRIQESALCHGGKIVYGGER